MEDTKVINENGVINSL